jgi:hypothetical protein
MISLTPIVSGFKNSVTWARGMAQVTVHTCLASVKPWVQTQAQPKKGAGLGGGVVWLLSAIIKALRRLKQEDYETLSLINLEMNELSFENNWIKQN